MGDSPPRRDDRRHVDVTSPSALMVMRVLPLAASALVTADAIA
jgi:hypothetical protein